MFSGIVQSVGTIGEFVQQNEGALLVVNTEKDFSGFEDGESIAVNGVCLTVVDSTPTTFKLDLSTETLNRTNFKDVKKETGLTWNDLLPLRRKSADILSADILTVLVKSWTLRRNRASSYFGFPILKNSVLSSWKKGLSPWMVSALLFSIARTIGSRFPSFLLPWIIRT